MKTLRNYHNLQDTSLRRKLRREATIQEKILWKYLQGSKLGYKFRRQHGIGKYIVDFCCPSKKLIIEIDGSQHIKNKIYDDERTLFLKSLGYTVVRFWDNEVNANLEGVIMKIGEVLKESTTP